MSLQTTYHFHEITIVEPAFSEFYFQLLKKVNYPDYRDCMVRAIKDQLRNLILAGKETGVMIEPETDIYKPLKEQGYPFDGIVYTLRELEMEGDGYLDKYADGASLKLTPKGKKWAMDLVDATPTITSIGVLNYFDIPERASEKLKILLGEINKLPDTVPYTNLISHQLRTILTLTLKHICKNNLAVSIPANKTDLRPLLTYVIQECAKQRTHQQLASELGELRDSKYKDIVDDIIHDDHTTANPTIVQNMMTRIKHILSLAYR